jgi:hypothetical protein
MKSSGTIHSFRLWFFLRLLRVKQELFTKQSPQRLKVLREHALIESAVSSNRSLESILDSFYN